MPDKGGWSLALPVAGGEDASLGAFQIKLGAELAGLVGASVLAEGGLEFKVGLDANGRQVQGVRGTRARRTGLQMRQKKFDVSRHVAPEGAAGADISAFAGAEGVLAVSGEANWLKPESADDFATFAMIKPSLAGQAGAGATAAFKISYDDNKLRIHCKLGACLGLGLKGAINAEVSPVTILEFQAWFYYQVMNAGSRNLAYFEDEAWDVFLRMQALAVLAGNTIRDHYEKSLRDLKKEINDWLSRRPKEVARVLAGALSRTQELLPEVRAFLLTMLQDAYKRLLEMGGDAIDYIRDLISAVEGLTDEIYLKSEYQNVLQYASLEIGAAGDARAMEEFLSQILGDVRVGELNRLKETPTPGYYVVSNRSVKYRMQNGTHLAWQGGAWWQNGNGQYA